MTYSQLFNQALELLDEQGAEEAYELVKQEWQNVENANEAQLYNLAYGFAALSGKAEEALGLMKEALYTKGYWYDYNYLMEDEDLEELRKHSEFETMANLCRERQQAALESAESVLVQEEVELLMRIGTDKQLVEMSSGIIENDRVRILSGPLMGMEGNIRRIDRHKRIAYLEIEMFGRTVEMKVGLEIIRKE